MPESRQYNPTLAEERVYRWLARSIETAGVHILYSNQGFVRPEKPFVTIDVLSDRQLQDAIQCDEVETSAGQYSQRTIEWRIATVQVKAFGRMAYKIMREVSRSIHRIDIQDANTADGLEVQESVSAIQSVSQTMGTTTEQARVQDYRIGYTEETIETNAYKIVQRVIGAGTLKDDMVPVDVDVTAP